MNIKILREYAKSKSPGCKDLVRYLEKENREKSLLEREYFFDHRSEAILPEMVTQDIDAHGKGVPEGRTRYFMLMVCPSRRELEHLSGLACGRKVNYTDPMTEGQQAAYLNLFKDFVLKVMEMYAAGFHRNVTKDDLCYYVKIENHRSLSSRDLKEQPGRGKIGEYKEGLQTHAHIIVARMDRACQRSLSPLSAGRGFSHQGQTENLSKSHGFYRVGFHRDCEKLFDTLFGYQREEMDHARYKDPIHLLNDPDLKALYELARMSQDNINQLEI